MGKRIGFGLIGNDKREDKREEQRTRNLLKLNALPAGTATMTIKETNQIANKAPVGVPIGQVVAQNLG